MGKIIWAHVGIGYKEQALKMMESPAETRSQTALIQ